MKAIAVYNLKGGVGKSSLAVNLAALSARQSARRTLLWDLDAQGASSWIIGTDDTETRGLSLGLFDRSEKIKAAARPSRIEGVDLIPADRSLRDLDHYLRGNAGTRRLRKLVGKLESRYDRLILDCPPGLSDITEQILRAAQIVIVPIVPSMLSERAFQEVVSHLRGSFKKKEQIALLPVHSMVDRRRLRHLEALEANPTWPVIPMSSAIEKMSDAHAPVMDLAPASHPAVRANRTLWEAIEKKLATL